VATKDAAASFSKECTPADVPVNPCKRGWVKCKICKKAERATEFPESCWK
jgi:hypothetical protein